ncbi:MAG: SPOR domain-containing protein [Gammaproteobacteria bacterium]|nr:SPOR domain-containing protein [Gammaproteobacteria bacterium]MBU1491353.1 SPOR domain-containing protein [Gammaproteobacteria bacterium]MBU2064618.1 SPOR domain-containing protein [Gammaproteobacteria bacterium]MBU2138616.1 SPOR domain-containing protein [Gammaproteobacteria bacterium]MBU2217061.1 SPOR domain-containing protein [Gammaproteobacteria bacterium]
MALLDNGLKQRFVGALVLVALAVIFLPMLLSREDELRRVVVDAPPVPQVPTMPEIEMQPALVPDPQALPDEPVPADPADPIGELLEQTPEVDTSALAAEAPAPQSAPAPQPAPAATPAPSVASAPVAAPSRLDANKLPVSWSVQLASLSSRAGAETLQKTLRTQGYNAYIRSVDGMNRVFVGPLIERAEADRLRDLLNRQQKLNGFVVRFQPEQG